VIRVLLFSLVGAVSLARIRTSILRLPLAQCVLYCHSADGGPHGLSVKPA
jgi:hypothetical protein